MYCTFIDYVADIYNTLMTAPRAQLKALENEPKQEVPAPLHSMLEKESKEDAILKHQARKRLFAHQHAQVLCSENLRITKITMVCVLDSRGINI